MPLPPSERAPVESVRIGDAVQSPTTGQLYLIVKVETDESGHVHLYFGRRGRDPSRGLVKRVGEKVTVKRKPQRKT